MIAESQVLHVPHWDRQEVCNYLKANYYPRYCPDHTPTDQDLLNALTYFQSNIMVGMRDGKVCGVAIYLTLNDATYENLDSFDLERVDVVARLMEQIGKNIHFILLCTDDKNVLWYGLSCAKKLNPKTISFWTPDMKRLVRKRF